MSETTHFAVINVAEHSGFVASVDGPAWPEPGGWTCQEITGSHGTILAEADDEATVQAKLDAWLECPGDGYCYTHRPHVDR